MDKYDDFNISEDLNFSNASNDDSMSVPDNSYSIMPSSNHNNTYFESNQDYFNISHEDAASVDFLNYAKGLFQYVKKNHYAQYVSIFKHVIQEHGEIPDCGRNTPLLYHEVHSLANLDFPGIIYMVIGNTVTNEGSSVSITNEIMPKILDYEQNFQHDYSKFYELQSDDYPGPLSIHKSLDKDIELYLTDQIISEIQETNNVDWDSGNLLINYLVLLIRDNGKPSTRNIVKLLNAGVDNISSSVYNSRQNYGLFEPLSRASFSRASSRASSRPPSPVDNILNDNVNNVGATSCLPSATINSLDSSSEVGSVTSMLNKVAISAQADQKVFVKMTKFKEYILSGRFEEAVKWASHSQMWTHALSLALRLNNQDLINDVLNKFSRYGIDKNDILYTMHELFSSKQPRIVSLNSTFSINEFSNWRSHLSMILSVERFHSKECKIAIESLGDKLIKSQDYYAGHLCYLLAETRFGKFDEKRNVNNNSTKPSLNAVGNRKFSSTFTSLSSLARRRLELIGWQPNLNASNSKYPRNPYNQQQYPISSTRRSPNLTDKLELYFSAPERCIKLTEIYEYALKFQNPINEISQHLLPYKYTMIYRMLFRRRIVAAYNYCKSIGTILGDYLRNNSNDSTSILEELDYYMLCNIRNISYKLHSYVNNMDMLDTDMLNDEISMNNAEDSNDSQWLYNIDDLYCEVCDKLKFFSPKNTQNNLESILFNKFNENLVETNSESHHNTPTVPSSEANHSVFSNNTTNVCNNSKDPMITKQYQPTPSSDIQPLQSINSMTNNVRSIPPPSELPTQAMLKKPTSRQHQYDIRNTNVSSTDNYYESKSSGYNMPQSQMPNIIKDSPTHQRSSVSNSCNSNTHPNSLQNMPNFSASNSVNLNSSMNSTTGSISGNFRAPMPPPSHGDKTYKSTPVSYQTPSTTISPPHQSQHQYNYPTNNSWRKFIIPAPLENNDSGGCSSNPIDIFNVQPTTGMRSRTQSTTSHTSGDNYPSSKQWASVPRSRNNSESKDSNINYSHNNTSSITNTNVQPQKSSSILESTKEENENKHIKPESSITTSKDSTNTSSVKNAAITGNSSYIKDIKGWFFRTKSSNLPADDNPKIRFDPDQNRWINDDNPDEDQVVAPPPMQSGGDLSQFKMTPSKYMEQTKFIKPAEKTVAPPSIPGFSTIDYNQPHLPQNPNASYNYNQSIPQQYNNQQPLSQQPQTSYAYSHEHSHQSQTQQNYYPQEHNPSATSYTTNMHHHYNYPASNINRSGSMSP